MPTPNASAKALRDARLRAGLSQVDVAGKLGVTQGAVSNHECGQNGLSLRTALAYADLYGVSVDSLTVRRSSKTAA